MLFCPKYLIGYIVRIFEFYTYPSFRISATAMLNPYSMPVKASKQWGPGTGCQVQGCGFGGCRLGAFVGRGCALKIRWAGLIRVVVEVVVKHQLSSLTFNKDV